MSARTVILGLACTAALATPVGAQVIAITGGEVHPVSGPAIPGGTVLIRDGRIAAVGAGVAIPPGATRIDATGKVVTPGLVHAATTLGLVEVGSLDGENSTEGPVTPSFSVVEGLDPRSTHFAIARMEGVTSAVVVPQGGMLAGQAAVIQLDGATQEAIVRDTVAALVGDIGRGASAAGDGARAEGLALLRRLFRDARELSRRDDAWRQNAIQPLAAPAEELRALLPFLDGTEPVMLTARSVRDIRNALRLAREYSLRLVIFGGDDAWQVAPELAGARVPVVVDAFANIPSFDGLGARWDNAAILAEAGVPVLIWEGESGGRRNLRFAAGHAVRNGMGHEAALEAVTLAPARAFGLADRMGSLEVGKVADVVVWSGDPFEFSTRAEHVLIAGREMPEASRQRELLERYRVAGAER